jgi:hypothetical protein
MQNIIKKIILILTFLILVFGIYFGYTFYKNSQNTNQTSTKTINTNPGRTPFQTRVSTSTEVKTIIEGGNEVINPTTTISTTKPRLVELWKEPVSGFDFVYKDIEVLATSTNNSSTTIIENVKNKKILKNQEFIYLWDRKTGHIYENLASTTEINKIANYTLPEVEEAYFIDNSSLITRKLESDNDTITTNYLKLTKEFSTSTVYITDIKNIAIDSDNISYSKIEKKIFYFINKTGKGILSTIDGNTRKNIINTTLSEWLSQYVNKNTIALTTKPSAYFKGYLFLLNTDGSSKNTYIIGEKYGFNTLTSPDGKKVIYNEIINNTLETFIYDIKSKSSTYLSQATIVDKCVWSNDSKKIFCGIPQTLYQAPYPDDWYKNQTSFSDNMWSIDPETGEFTLTIALQDQISKPIDVYHISISNDNRYMIFQDKNTLSLWKYDLVY